MSKTHTSFVFALASSFLLFVPAARAEMCAIDVVPAATLLLPYFEVDLDDENGVNTLFSINNATTEPTIAHVTFWTNYSQPSLDFDIFLTGYDVQMVNLRDAFSEASLPVTADEQNDPVDAISPHGANPEWDGTFSAPPDCANFFPWSNPVIPAFNQEIIVLGHTGKPISFFDDQCLGADFGDNIARGYVTVDVARRCSIEFPSDSGYFGGFDPVAIDDNRLWGDFVIQWPSQGAAARDTLVHIEADPAFDGTTTDSGYTFYGRYSGGADHREPLSSAWGARYFSGVGETLGTDFLVWRDSTSSVVPNDGFDCAEGPAWLPLEEGPVLCFNEEESFVEMCTDGACFPLETQRVEVGGADLPVPYPFGWCQIDFNHSDDFVGDVDFPNPGSPVTQSYVTTLNDQDGLFTTASRAVSLGSACVVPMSYTNLFADDFETGDLGGWTQSVP